VGTDGGGVEDEPLEVRVSQSIEDRLPDLAPRPAIEASPGFIPVAEAFGEVAPWGPRLADPENGIREQAIVLRGSAGRAWPTGEQMLDALPLPIGDSMAA
jgi:hypothetical protein